jgi:tetratricopeptide (TPR) repeat protein
MNISDNNSKIPTLCLNMIVKNESRIIERLLTSVLPIIDTFCICDTGSTDNTIELIENFGKKHNIPGKVVQEPFKNFCYNRTFALQACVGMSDYILLLDADMILEIRKFDKKILNTGDNFFLLQGSESFYYKNLRIVKNNGLYKYVGVTHEHIATPPDSVHINIDKNVLFINDIGDGGAKNDKFERDIRLLTEGIKEEPNNERYYFYLANSYHDSGKFEEAIKTYKKRIEMGGWIQEVWYSYYRIGLSYMRLDRPADAINAWLNGYESYPERLENLYEIIKYYRVLSKHKLAYTFYKMALEKLYIQRNKDDYLFLHNNVYTYEIEYEYSIIAYYLGIRNINNNIITILNNSNDDNLNRKVLENMKFYKDTLTSYKIFDLSNKLEVPINNESTNFNSSSSCLIKDDNTYKLNIRYVNYNITNNGSYLNCDKNIITINKFIEFDYKFDLINDKIFGLLFNNRRYIGIEDVRIYKDSNNELLFMGTGLHENNNLGIMQGKYNTDDFILRANEIKCTFKDSGCEKNWVFFEYKGETHVIYNWYPLTISKIEDNKLNLVEIKQVPKIFKYFRGSTNGFHYFNEQTNKKEIWFVVHLVSYESPRHYYHAIVVFDDNLNLLRYSAPFKFSGEPIEYCLSIVVEEDKVIINYSEWDRTTKIGFYKKSYIDSKLIYNQ